MNLVSGTVQANGDVRVAVTTLRCQTDGIEPGSPVTVAIRPEDINAQVIADGEVIFIEIEIKHLEFLGSFYRADLGGGAFSDLGLRADFSINLVRRKGVQQGSKLSVRLPPEFIRIYPGD